MYTCIAAQNRSDISSIVISRALHLLLTFLVQNNKMPRYSTDLKLRVLQRLDEGNTVKEVVNEFSVKRETVSSKLKHGNYRTMKICYVTEWWTWTVTYSDPSSRVTYEQLYFALFTTLHIPDVKRV